MPNVGLQSADGTVRKRWEEIDLESSDMDWIAPADPALLAFVLECSGDRDDVGDEVTASQLEKGDRAILLEATTDYYTTIDRQVASIMGTMKHSMVNKNRPGFITEVRLPLVVDDVTVASAKCDTFHIPTGKLSDLKAIKWYAIKMMLLEGVLKAKPGYAYQINLFRILLHQQGWGADVKTMQLTCIPPDMTAQNKKEAQKLGLQETAIIPILVPTIPDVDVIGAYVEKYKRKKEVLAAGYAPVCSAEERWDAPSGFPTKCAYYCPIKEQCIDMSARFDERHPLVEWDLRKAVKPVPVEKPRLGLYTDVSGQILA